MAHKVSPTPARVALGLLALILIGTLAGLNMHSHAQLLELRRKGVEAAATVVAKHCSNHGQVTYSFEVDGRRFSGAGFCVSDCNTTKLGTTVKVIYAAGNPRNSECDGLTAKRDRLKGNYLGLLVISIMLGAAIYRMTSGQA